MTTRKKILVTGGAGYIGSHTAVELIEQGYQVLIADNLSNSSESSIEGIEKITGAKPIFEKIDLCCADTVADFFSRHPDINATIHFAASKAVGESVANPLLYYSNNIQYLINILREHRRNSIQGLVFSSSCTVYGQPEKLPVSEASPVLPAASPYGNTKQVCEEIIADSVAAYPTMRCIALRYFNPIGAHPSAIIGEQPNGVPSNLVPFLTQAAAGIRSELSVFGTDYSTPDGSCIRDYIDVVDLAKAHVAAIKRLDDAKSLRYDVFNLGTGRGVSVLELIDCFEKVTGQKVPVKIAARRPGDVEKVWADANKANNVLGWKANRSIEETLLSAWEWQKKLL
jgi:UDP-glucose 4-epimerase